MKILQIIQKHQLRGAEVFACQLSEQLNARGHEAIIVTVFEGKVPLPFQGKMYSLRGVARRRLWDWQAWRTLAEIIAREKPDLVQANAGDTLKYAALSKLFFRWQVPIVFRNASTISLYIKGKMARRWNAFLFSFAHYIISVSEFTKRDFIGVFPAFQAKIKAVPVGIQEKPVTSTFKATRRPFFIHIGGFTFEKNHKGLLAIFARIRQTYPDATLGLIGDGPLKASVESLVAAGGMEAAVMFLGYQPEPMQYLKQADALLLPSVIEGLPSVILEAFYAKVPVVSYRVGGIPEIVRPAETGWLIKQGDEEAFAHAAVEAVTDRSKALEFTDKAFKLVMENYTMQQVTTGFEGVYGTLIEKREARQN